MASRRYCLRISVRSVRTMPTIFNMMAIGPWLEALRPQSTGLVCRADSRLQSTTKRPTRPGLSQADRLGTCPCKQEILWLSCLQTAIWPASCRTVRQPVGNDLPRRLICLKPSSPSPFANQPSPSSARQHWRDATCPGNKSNAFIISGWMRGGQQHLVDLDSSASGNNQHGVAEPHRVAALRHVWGKRNCGLEENPTI